MSSAIFQLIRDSASQCPTMDSLPSLESLYRIACDNAFVFQLKQDANNSHHSGSTSNNHASRNTAAAGYEAHTTTTTSNAHTINNNNTAAAAVKAPLFDGVLENILIPELTEKSWPRTLADLPLFVVSHTALQSSQVYSAPRYGGGWSDDVHMMTSAAGPASPFTEVLYATRWEVAANVFAIERYQLLAVPACAKTSSSSDAERDAAMLHDDNNTIGNNNKNSGGSSECEMLLPGQLTLSQQHYAKVLCTLCRVVSTASGTPPTPDAANAALLKSVPSGLRHTFFHSCTALLGVSPHVRQEQWRRAQLMLQPTTNVNHNNNNNGGGSSNSSRQCTNHESLLLSEQGQSNSIVSDRTPLSDGAHVPHDTSITARSECGGGIHTGSNHHYLLSNNAALSGRARLPCLSHISNSNTNTTNNNNANSGFISLNGSLISPTVVPSSISPSVVVPTANAASAAADAPLLWRGQALPRLFEDNVHSGLVTKGWATWTMACKDGLSRALIVNSMDDIVQYCGCSRAAFYTAAAYLDCYVALATDPVGACRRYLNHVQLPCGGSFTSLSLNQDLYEDEESTSHITSADVCRFFTQVIAVCAMLGCKNTDTYPPRLGKILLCLQADTRLSPSQFTILELTVLNTIKYALQPVTVNELVEGLLAMGGGEALEKYQTEMHYMKSLEHRRGNEAHLQEQVAQRVAAYKQRQKREAALVSFRENAAAAAAGNLSSHNTNNTNSSISSGNKSSGNTSNDRMEWQQLCSFSCFICDLVTRGRKSTANQGVAPTSDQQQQHQQSSSSADILSVHDMHPAVVAIAVIAVAAEALRFSLPQPLFALLPRDYQRMLRERGRFPTHNPDGVVECNDSNSSSSGRHFLLSTTDKMYTILLEFCRLAKLSGLQQQQQQQQPPLVSDVLMGGGAVADAIPELHDALRQVQMCYEECRRVPCDPILRRRYKEMFAAPSQQQQQ